MEVILSYKEDIIERYIAGRKTVTREDAEDLLRIILKYLKFKMKSNDYYAINTPIGIFFKDLNTEMFDKLDIASTKEQVLNERIFINSQLKVKKRKDYKHEDFELIKANTNNHFIENKKNQTK